MRSAPSLGGMSNSDRTPEPPGDERGHDAELERLVQAGANLRRGEASSVERDAYLALRHSIGRYRGSTMKRVAVVSATLVVALAWALYVTLVPNPFGESAALNIPMWVTLAAAIVAIAVPPYASKKEIAAEEQWVASHPFRLEGYFAAISRPARRSPTIEFELLFRSDRVPAEDMLVNLLSTVTRDAKVVRLNGNCAELREWVFTRKGVTSISVVPARVHDMVDKVFAPLHRSYPIERVSVKVAH